MAREKVIVYSPAFHERIVRTVLRVESFRLTGNVRFHKTNEAMSGLVLGGDSGGGGATLAVARLTGAGSKGDGWYKAREIVWNETAGEWQDLADGRVWDGGEGHEPEAYEPDGTTGLAPDGEEIVPVVLLRGRDQQRNVMWLMVYAPGTGLPEGEGQYKVLQLDAEDNPHWDWVRAHA